MRLKHHAEPPPPQEYKGWLYRTAHGHRVDQTKPWTVDGDQFVEQPIGWDLCMFDEDVQFVCEKFGWGSHALVLKDGRVCYTAACGSGDPGQSAPSCPSSISS